MVLHEEEKNWKKKKNKSGQIPAFGNWDYANELPITQYFESARQAGLIRFSYSSAPDSMGHSDPHLYDLHHTNYTNTQPPPYKAKIPQAKEYRRQSLKQEEKSSKGDYQTEPQRQKKLNNYNKGGGGAARVPHGHQKNTSNIINVKAVDKDLYKIPPELLHSSKRKKRWGFFSRCWVPTCMV